VLQKDLLNRLKDNIAELISITQDRFLSMDSDVLSTKPSKDRWSILECIEHLNITLEVYIPQMNAVVKNSEKYPVKSNVFEHSFLGKLAVKVMKPKADDQIPFKMKTFKSLEPVNTNIKPQKEISQFIKYQNEILTIIDGLQKVNLRKPKITTAAGPIIKMSIGDALHFMVAHNQRHIVQAQNVFKIIQ